MGSVQVAGRPAGWSVKVTGVEPPTPPTKPATIYDVAAAVGVSPSTVSRAFSRPGRVSAKTAARIQQAAAELGYRAPTVARAEAFRQSKLLGIALTDITNPFFFSIIRGAEHVAVAEGYSIMLIDSEESEELERRLFDRTMPLLDGMIVAASRLSDAVLRGAAKTTPTVSLNRLVPGLPSVVTDNAVACVGRWSTSQSWGTAGSPTSRGLRRPGGGCPVAGVPGGLLRARPDREPDRADRRLCAAGRARCPRSARSG